MNRPCTHRPGPLRCRSLSPTPPSTAPIPSPWQPCPRDLPLVYVGNQYDRDDAFDRFFAPAAAAHPHLIAGKWPHTQRWSGLHFHGRIPFTEVDALYRRSATTLLLLPDRYAEVGHMTQRLFEAVLAGCLPLTPATVRDAARFTPAELHVIDGAHAAGKIEELMPRMGTAQHAELLGRCLDRLELLRLSRQLDTVERLLSETTRRRGS